MSLGVRIFGLLSLLVAVFGAEAKADSQTPVPKYAECSVGTYSVSSWYGDVILGQTLKIRKATKEVEIINDLEDQGDEFLEVHVDLHWINPRYTPTSIVLTTSTAAVFARDGVTLIDRPSDTMIYCGIKK